MRTKTAIRQGAAALAVLGVVTATATPAIADHLHDGYYYIGDGSYDSPEDAGGTNAWARFTYEDGSGDWHFAANASFQAYGEILRVVDNKTDGHGVAVEIMWYPGGEGSLEWRRYWTGTSREINLSFDEGTPYSIRLCMDQNGCTKYAPWGKA